MSNISEETDLIEMNSTESDNETLYRLATPPGQLSEREISHSKDNGVSDNRAYDGPNSIHTNWGARGDSSDRPLNHELLSWARRSEMPIENVTIAEIYNATRTVLPSFDMWRDGFRQQNGAKCGARDNVGFITSRFVALALSFRLSVLIAARAVTWWRIRDVVAW